MFHKLIKTKPLLGVFSVVLAFNAITLFSTPTQAETVKIKSDKQSKVSSNNGLPFHRRDGGTRSSCGTKAQDFVALIPATAVNLTASSNPKLYFHVPQTNQSQTIEFVLRDRDDRLVHEAFIETEAQGGIMNIEIPLPHNYNKSLESDSNYRWYLSYICNNQKRSQDIVLEGWIQQQKLSQEKQAQIANYSLHEQVSYYQKSGLWHDAIATAAQHHEFSSDSARWSEFLSNIGLDEFAERPLIN